MSEPAEEEGNLHASAWAAAPEDAGGGSERSSEGVRRREDDAVVGGEHQAEVGERGEGVVTGERVEEGVPRGHIARGSGDILEDGEGGREERPREGAVEGD